MRNVHPISFYLNQKYVFDILAILEDGFYQMQNLKKSNFETKEKGNAYNGEIGYSNAFAFLGITFGAKKLDNKKIDENSETQYRKVHTPNSLFAKMRETLIDKGLVRSDNFLEAKPGEFIEFKATLRKNPIIDNLESYFAFFKLGMSFQDKPKSKIEKDALEKNKQLVKQIDSLIEELKYGSNNDIIGEIVESNLNSVLTIDNNFLNDPTLNDIADGEFSVFGKVIKVIGEDSEESINLLRKTSLSKVNDAVLEQMFGAFQNLENEGIESSNFDTVINSPAIQVIPISIFT